MAQLHDPVTFKILSEHSHIVAISTTGNVFLADSVKQFGSAGRDLVSDVPFKKEDIITLQDPHNFGAPSSVTPSEPSSTAKKITVPSTVVKPAPSSTPGMTNPSTSKAAAPQPYNISPYSTGHAGASLTSTAVGPRTETDVALFDEEELMYDEISRVKKEKDLAKKRAYVRIVTNMGGSLNLELFCEKAPKTCYNFLMLARQGKYNNCPFHRLIQGFMVQGGDPTGTGRGGESYWGTPFRDEYDLKGAEKHSERGMLSMANKGMNTNGSQFFITFRATPHLDGKHTVFGKLVGGEEILDAIEGLPVQPKTDRPLKPITITEIVIYADPFEDYKERLARKLQANSLDTKSSVLSLPSVSTKHEGKESKKERDDVNWFGVKLGSESVKESTLGAGGVGKYLKSQTPVAAAKRDADDVLSLPEDAPKKKRKLGFGNFENW
ncbi:cyclophilin-like domain-containing protein [Cantharellus anzutake]|uniref:cyclophilin-like domain-containing protein n=1 Tax=Cantharellus anzutake TaxID=1750568 RepID=UPI0019056D17|nr:cyclophilin-like domain-containing protein [Cantharellus anzutake]KAF8331495.1 cyclophilin-like domain-containing protein [Cantharellus anzutake]